MIKYTVMYPLTPGARFDLDYYQSRHMAIVLEAVGNACRGHQVAQGLSAAAPNTEPTYCVMSELYFDSVEAFEAAITPHVPKIRADIPNFTDITPIRQISQIVLEQRA
jgi:uncharacterized protein (TIGR02118 family)